MRRFLHKLVFLSLAVVTLALDQTYGQQIYYSALPGVRAATTHFEIIGQYNGKQLIYTKNYSSHQITCYNNTMEAVDTIQLDFLPYDLTDVHFVALPGSFIMLYQFTKKRDIYCKAVRFNSQGEKTGEPELIDKTLHPLDVVGDLAYSDVVSKDKNRLMIYKLIKKQGDKHLTLKTFLLDSTLKLLQNGQISFPYDYDNAPLQIRLSNSGGLYFLYGAGGYPYQPYFGNISLYYKPPHENKVLTRRLLFEEHLPSSHPLLTINETKQELWINTFNFDTKKRHLVGLSTYQFGLDSIRQRDKNFQEFSADVRKLLARKRNRRKSVFDNFAPRKLIFSRSGDALLIAEKEFHDADNKTYYGTLGLFSLDKSGEIKEIQQIVKEQGQYSYTNSGSFIVVNNGRALHFLVNKAHGVTRFLNNHIYLLRDYRFLQDKSLEKMPLMAHMDKGFNWLPGLGKQTSLKKVVIPCLSGGNLLFSCIVY